MAKMAGYKKGRFSFNIPGGRCEKCQGAGVLRIEMQFLADLYITCDVCLGSRYNSQTLSIKYKDKSINEILNMTTDEVIGFFDGHHQIKTKLQALLDVGLPYIELGRPAPTLSGGEAQRIKLAKELCKKEVGSTLYILDEPTTGLHMYDIEKLITALKTLVKRGNTVIIIEHNLDIISNCDHIIDLGPGGGDSGGNLIYQGPTKQLLLNKQSYTGQSLRKYLSSKSP